MYEAATKRVLAFRDTLGREPFTDWIKGLRDIAGRKRILARVKRLEQGNFGDCKVIGEGVSELRLFFGPGYRVYFGQTQHDIVLLLCGGDKSTQEQDIIAAQAYWKEHLSNAKLSYH